MIVLTPATTPQTIRFIPRVPPNTMIITDEQTNVPVTVTINSYTSGDYVDSITANFALKANRFYTLKLITGIQVTYLDRIFCTDQPIDSYSVNFLEYTSNTTSNTYIVYE